MELSSTVVFVYTFNVIADKMKETSPPCICSCDGIYILPWYSEKKIPSLIHQSTERLKKRKRSNSNHPSEVMIFPSLNHLAVASHSSCVYGPCSHGPTTYPSLGRDVHPLPCFDRTKPRCTSTRLSVKSDEFDSDASNPGLAKTTSWHTVEDGKHIDPLPC